jgi:hypothetical protein
MPEFFIFSVDTKNDEAYGLMFPVPLRHHLIMNRRSKPMRIFIILLTCICAYPIQAQHRWEAIDFTGLQRIHALTQLPSGDILAGSDWSGLYRSTDGGLTWRHDMGEWRTLWSLYWHESRLIAGSDRGPIYSDDNGDTWSTPTHSIRLLRLASMKIADIVSTERGQQYLYYSSDKGETWISKYSNLGSRMRALSIATNNDDHIFIGLDVLEMQYSPDGGLYRSEDMGATFHSVDARFEKREVRDILIDGLTMLIAMPKLGIGLSTDGGMSWDILPVPGIRVIVHGSVGEYWAAGEQGVYRSTDGGLNWSMTSNPDFTIHTLLYTPSFFLAGADNQGIFRSADGHTWSRTNLDYNSVVIQAIATHYATSSIYIAQRQTETLHFNSDGISRAPPEFSNAEDIMIANDLCVYVAGDNGIWYSVDKGRTALPDTAGIGGVGMAAISLDIDGTQYAAGKHKGLYQSPGRGSVWRSLGEEIFDTIRVLSVLPVLGSFTYIGTQANGMYMIDNFTGKVEKVAYPFPEHGSIQTMTRGRYYTLAASDSALFVMKSSRSWQLFSPALNQGWITDISTGADGEIFVSTVRGVFQFYHHIGEWRSLELDKHVNCIARLPNYRIYAGTNGEGVFGTKHIYTGIPPAAPSSARILGVNYPNPFIDHTVLPLRMEQPAYLRVTLHDVLGREIRTLYDGWLQQGHHELSIDAHDLTPGVYVIRAGGAANSESRMLLLTR